MRFDDLKQSAQRRLDEERAGKTRVVVQVGHCSQSVGAGQVAGVLASAGD